MERAGKRSFENGLRDGDRLVYQASVRTVALVDRDNEKVPNSLSGDNKIDVPFLETEDQFYAFAQVLGSFFGLAYCVEEHPSSDIFHATFRAA